MATRRTRRLIGVAVVLALLAGLVGGLYYKGPRGVRDLVDDVLGRTPVATDTVGPEGDTLSFDDGVTISVPKGAVTKKTTLRFGAVSALRAQDNGPFKGARESAVRFEVGLVQDGVEVQPKQPLTMRLPLAGKFKGHGMPLAYTMIDGGSFALLPSKQQKPGTLTIQLPHLSPKVLTYLSDQQLLGLFRDKEAIAKRDTCAQEIDVNSTKVRIGAGKQGWSLKDDSAILACLVAGDGTANVGITNRVDFMLSVAATSNVRLATSSGDVQEELVKVINNLIFPNKKVKALLSSGAKLVGETNPGDLPATVELRGDPNTFFSEVAYNTVALVVGLLTGEGDGPKLAKKIEAVFNSADVMKCMQTSATHLGGSPSIGDVGKTLYDCFLPIAGAMAKQLDIQWWKFGWIVGALKTGYETAVRSVNGIRLTLNNTMRVPVEVNYQLDDYVGDWFVHGSKLHVNSDGTGWQQWNGGPCFNDLSVSTIMCTGHSTLKVRRVSGGIQVTRMGASWYTDDSGIRRVPESVTEYGEDASLRAGFSSTLLAYKGDVRSLRSTRGQADSFGNPYLCRQSTVDTVCDKPPA